MDKNNLGSFNSLQELWEAHPEGGHEGDYATVNGVVFRWNKYNRIWSSTGTPMETHGRKTDLHEGDVIITNDLTVAGMIRARGVKQPNKGLFHDLASLQKRYPFPEVGWWATVGDSVPGQIYRCDQPGVWSATGETGGLDSVDYEKITKIEQLLQEGYTFMGVATLETKPGTPDQKVFYIANGKGTYPNFGGINVDEDEIVLLTFDTSWHKTLTGIASQAKLIELCEILDTIDNEPVAGSNNLVKSGGVSNNINLIAQTLKNSSITITTVSGGVEQIFDFAIPANTNFTITWVSGRWWDSGMAITFYNGSTIVNSVNKTYIRSEIEKTFNFNTSITRIGIIQYGSVADCVFSFTNNISIKGESNDFLNPNAETKKKLATIGSVVDGAIPYKLYNLNTNIVIGKGINNETGEYKDYGGIYNSSGNLYVNESLEYSTNQEGGSIFCYSDNKYLGFVSTGSALISGTKFVRLNWLASRDTPYFILRKDISLSNELNGVSNKLSSVKTKVDDSIDEIYKVNGEDILRYEFGSNGLPRESANHRISQFVHLKSGMKYKGNTTYYYFYSKEMSFISSQSIDSNTFFDSNTVLGACFVRTESPIATPIVITEYDAVSGEAVLYRRVFNGYSENTTPYIDTVNSLDGYYLPKESATVEIDFTTKQSVFDRTKSALVPIFSFDNGLRFSSAYNGELGESIFERKVNASYKIMAVDYTLNKSIFMHTNMYGKNLFSIRLKYPVVTLDADGKSTMVTPMPTVFEDAYIAKSDTEFTIYYSDDTVYRTYILANYNDVAELVDAMKADLSSNFDIIKYSCEGVAFTAIDNFSKIKISAKLNETYYRAYDGENPIKYTGNVYYDSYPTFIKTSDIGYKHKLIINYHIDNGFITKMQFIIDGMFHNVSGISLPIMQMLFTANSNFVDTVYNVKISPYHNNIAPLISMHHNVVVSDKLSDIDMVNSTFRIETILGYFSEKGVVGVNLEDAVRLIRGDMASTRPVYCLTFDDKRTNLWTNEIIRNIFNKYRAKPTLVFNMYIDEIYNANTLPASFLTKEQYQLMKSFGWCMTSHGFSGHTDTLSYAQLVKGFEITQNKWQEFYGDSVFIYSPHNHTITTYQNELIKALGYQVVDTTYLGESYGHGAYCANGAMVNCAYYRVMWMGDDHYSWDSIKNNIEVWINP